MLVAISLLSSMISTRMRHSATQPGKSWPMAASLTNWRIGNGEWRTGGLRRSYSPGRRRRGNRPAGQKKRPRCVDMRADSPGPKLLPRYRHLLSPDQHGWKCRANKQWVLYRPPLVTGQLIGTNRAVNCLGDGAFGLGVLFQKLNDVLRHIHASGRLDTLKTRRGIDLQDQGATVRAQQVDTGDFQSKRRCGLDRDALFFRRQHRRHSRATAMQIGAKFAWAGDALHGGNHLATNDEATQVASLGLADEFLHQEIGVEATESLDDAL